MAEFKSAAPATKVSDPAVMALVHGMGEFSSDSLEALDRQGVESSAPDVRYAPQAWLDDFQAIPEYAGPSTVFEIGEKISRFGFIELGGNRAKLVCANSSPCELDERLIIRMAERSASKARFAKVTHDPTQPCRQKGGTSCTYILSW
jgi:hypothetical protein